jgi:hypothetical protein
MLAARRQLRCLWRLVISRSETEGLGSVSVGASSGERRSGLVAARRSGVVKAKRHSVGSPTSTTVTKAALQITIHCDRAGIHMLFTAHAERTAHGQRRAGVAYLTGMA